MVSNPVSCTVMGVSMSAYYLPLVLLVLSSYSIFEEFLPYLTFEEAGEFTEVAIVIIFTILMKQLSL
jgi:hypothetical protein